MSTADAQLLGRLQRPAALPRDEDATRKVAVDSVQRKRQERAEA